MTLQVKHKFVSPIADGSDTSQVRPSNWNDTHEVTGAVEKVNGVSPDAGGNITINVDGKVLTVNGVTPDANGNITINVDGKVLTVNGVSPDANGNVAVSFAMPSKYEFFAIKSGSQNISSGTSTKLNHGTMQIGNASYYSAANSRFTAPQSGLYFFYAAMGLTSAVTGRMQLYKNGSAISPRIEDHGVTATDMYDGQMILQLAAGDYVEVWARTNSSCTSNTDCSYFMGFRLN